MDIVWYSTQQYSAQIEYLNNSFGYSAQFDYLNISFAIMTSRLQGGPCPLLPIQEIPRGGVSRLKIQEIPRGGVSRLKSKMFAFT